MIRVLAIASISLLGGSGSRLYAEEGGESVVGKAAGTAAMKVVASPQQEKEIRELIEMLVITERESVLTDSAEGVRTAELEEELAGYIKARKDAFNRLTAFQELAFPMLAEYFDDDRPSAMVWNHIFARTVGTVCYRVVHNQLMELPPDYSDYGLTRIGRDGERHIKPYWEPEPYADSNGLANWLRDNEGLSYAEKRIKCLNWLLDGEKKIGVIDPGGYYTHVFALELEILKQKAAMGKDVAEALARALVQWEARPADQVPKELLPDGPLPEIEEKHALQERSAMLGACPDGHVTLRDVPILYGTFPVQTKNPRDWNDEDKALAARRDAKEVILGGEWDSAEDPRFRPVCLTCGYEYVTRAVPDLGANWLKRGNRFADFTTRFSEVARSLPFARMPDAEISVEVNKEKAVVSETIKIAIPSSKKAEFVGRIETWCDEKGFDRALIHVEKPLFPRPHEQPVVGEEAWFYIKVDTDPKKATTVIRYHFWRWDF